MECRAVEGFYVLYSIIHVRLYNHVVSKDVKHKYILIYLGLIYASFYDNCEQLLASLYPFPSARNGIFLFHRKFLLESGRDCMGCTPGMCEGYRMSAVLHSYPRPYRLPTIRFTSWIIFITSELQQLLFREIILRK